MRTRIGVGCAVVVACTFVFAAGAASGAADEGPAVDCSRMGSLVGSLEWMIKAHGETGDPERRRNLAWSIAHVLLDDYDADPESVSLYAVCDGSEEYEALRAEALKIAEKPTFSVVAATSAGGTTSTGGTGGTRSTGGAGDCTKRIMGGAVSKHLVNGAFVEFLRDPETGERHELVAEAFGPNRYSRVKCDPVPASHQGYQIPLRTDSGTKPTPPYYERPTCGFSMEREAGGPRPKGLTCPNGRR